MLMKTVMLVQAEGPFKENAGWQGLTGVTFQVVWNITHRCELREPDIADKAFFDGENIGLRPENFCFETYLL